LSKSEGFFFYVISEQREDTAYWGTKSDYSKCLAQPASSIIFICMLRSHKLRIWI